MAILSIWNSSSSFDYRKITNLFYSQSLNRSPDLLSIGLNGYDQIVHGAKIASQNFLFSSHRRPDFRLFTDLMLSSTDVGQKPIQSVACYRPPSFALAKGLAASILQQPFVVRARPSECIHAIRFRTAHHRIVEPCYLVIPFLAHD